LKDKSFILVTGATGAVGPRVVAELLESGCKVRTFSLDKPPDHWFSRVDAQIGDITDPVSIQTAMQGVDTVIHLAALLHIVNPPPEMREKYERINVGGTAIVADAAIRAGVQRVILFSTIAVYGPSNGRILTEDAKPSPDTFYAETKLSAEKIVLGATGVDGEKIGTVLRLGAVYGSRIKGNYERLTHALARRRFIPIGNGLNRRTLVYDKDVARAAVLAASHPAAGGRLFNVTDGNFHTLKEIIETICSAIGRKPSRLSLPLRVTRGAAGLLEGLGKATKVPIPAVRSMIDKYTEDVAVDGHLIQKELGFVPEYGLKKGWEETISEMRRLGYL